MIKTNSETPDCGVNQGLKPQIQTALIHHKIRKEDVRVAHFRNVHSCHSKTEYLYVLQLLYVLHCCHM